MAKKITKLMLNGEEYEIREYVPSRLPSEYQEVEYIESSGTQYISTNIVPSDTKGIYLKLSSQDVASDLLYIGSRKTTDTRFWIGNNTAGGHTNIYLGWNTFTYYANPTANNIYEIKLNYLNDRKNQVDSTVVENNIGTLSSSNNIPIAIFAGNEDGTIITPSKIKLYSCQITDGSDIVNDFVPCYRKSDNIIGLYDTVNSQFYTNSGTGTFTKGPDGSSQDSTPEPEPQTEPCHVCEGTGEVDCNMCGGTGEEMCPSCQGTGQVGDPEDPESRTECPDCDGGGFISCGNCAGSGKMTCEWCGGTGEEPGE